MPACVGSKVFIVETRENKPSMEKYQTLFQVKKHLEMAVQATQTSERVWA